MAPGQAPYPLNPCWAGMLRLTCSELPVGSMHQIVEVDLPPAILIGDIGQVAPIRGKTRLKDTDVRPSSEQTTLGEPW